MKRLKVYLDTSILNFIFDDNNPDERDLTSKFFDQVNNFEPYISDVVLAELNRCPDPKKSKMLELVDKHNLDSLPLDDSAEELARNILMKELFQRNIKMMLFILR